MLSNLFLGALSVLAWTTCVVQAATQITFPELPPTGHAQVVQDNFLGISFELSSFDTLWGKTNTTLPSAIQNYLSNIRSRISHNLRIRIGGNGMDSSTYVPDQEAMIVLTDPDAYFNDIPADFGPMFFYVLNAMADAVGEMQFIIGLSMQNPSNDSNVVELATAAVQLLGGRLDAMLLGNEPDLYAGHGTRDSYIISDYIPEITEVLNDLHNAEAGDLISKPLIGGPTTCCSWDLDDVITAGLGSDDYKYYSIQHYPTYYCNGPTDANTNMSYFLSHTNIPKYVNWNADGVTIAQQQGVPVLVTEYNTVSCGGSPTISPTFAASLWAVDAGLQFGASNMSAAYLHTREYGITYNLFDPPSDTSTEPNWRTGSPYYSTLVLAETISPNGSIIVDLNVDNSTTNVSSHVAGYGIYDNGGTAQGKLVLINYSNDTEHNFTLSTNITHALGLRVLSAPSVNEQTEISWAGQTVRWNGELDGVQTTSYLECQDGCTITVPGPGLVLALLDPNASDTDSFYTGNSTVAGAVGYISAASQSQPMRFSMAWAVLAWAAVGLLFAA
ncbi:hypothetical protein EW146_g9112 [Bondarzewia mesenterica]|uniref:Beta-glucuronidase C-terminal domain-containing protein n=1 Tax=Bondarzewia mesenterica TaxID=1095465 RepID=A0A4S4L8U3_9AGAM|nr:hypothetical protein EW146_g9112 [Bondarzewia mesenterica]